MRNRTQSYCVPQTALTDSPPTLPHMLTALKQFFIIFTALLLACATASATQLTLAWDENDPAPDGYNVYWRTTETQFNYSEPIWSGGSNSCTINLPTVPENIQCYFVVRAYMDDDESGDSNEVGYLLEGASNDTKGTNVSSSLQSYSITATAGEYGTITPSGKTTVTNGSNKTFTITPDAGYTITDVKVDGISVGAVSSYRFTRVTADHTISAAFRYANQRPVANAGADLTTQPSIQVTLNGSTSSDAEGFQLDYRWTQTSGPTVTMVDADTARPSFTAPAGTTSEQALNFRLTVTDQEGASSTDDCTVKVSAIEAPNQQPQADAGTNLKVLAGTTVTLDGSNSIDPDGVLISYKWVQTAGPAVQLSIKSPAVATFTAPAPSDTRKLGLLFELTVTDNGNSSCTDTCLVQVLLNQPDNGDGDGMPTDQDATPTSDPDDWTNSDENGTGDTDDSKDDWNDADSTATGRNQPPLQPLIVYPQTGDDSVSLRPKILASEFKDPDAEDYHFATEWRIIDTESQSTVLNVKRNYYLTYLRVPMFILKRDTTYSCQVRYYDQDGNGSDWSPQITFTTYGRIFRWQEAATDDDGFALVTSLDTSDMSDFETTDVSATFKTLDEKHTISVSLHDNEDVISLVSAGAVPTGDEASTPPDFDKGVYRFGLIGNRIDVAIPGAEATVKLYFDDDVSRTTNWITFTADGQWVDDQSSVQLLSDGRSVVRTVTDGGQDDADGVANGVVVDLVAPLTESTPGDDLPIQDLDDQNQPRFSSENSGPMGCFIGSLIQ